MGAELWGTFAVNDHCRLNAFAREVLLFDRLVVPVPATGQERDRWRRPNPASPRETWDPDRLDTLLGILGSQRHEGQNGGRLAWEADWDEYRWKYEKSRAAVAETVTRDPYAATRKILTGGEEIPVVVEAVAAFPSAQACYRELRPVDKRPEDLTAAHALIALAYPLLSPNEDEGHDFRPLRDAVELARDPEFQDARAAYHNWMREFVSNLQAPGVGLDEVKLNPSSLELGEEKLRKLRAKEYEIIKGDERRKRWTVVEYALTVVGVGAAVGIAFANPLVALGVFGPLAGFGGWVAAKRAAPEAPARPLGGASMFVTAERRLGWSSGPV